MTSDHHGPRKSAGRIGSIALKAMLFVIAMALPLSAQAPGSWTISGSLRTARANHAAAMLPNGQALIVGGIGSSGAALTSAEIFNLASNSFTTVPTGLAVGVSGLTATVLNDNTVLLAGGLNSAGKSVNTAELYDPSAGGFIKLPAMKVGAQPSYCDAALRWPRADSGRILHHRAGSQRGDFRSFHQNLHGGRAIEARADGSYGDAAR